MSKFSFYKGGITQTTPTHTIGIEQLINLIRSDRNKLLCEKIRAEPDKKKRNELKKQLDYITLAGVFESRANEKIKTSSGLCAIDVDDVKNLESLREKLCNDPFVLFCAISPSGQGLKLGVKIPPEITNYVGYLLGFYHYIHKKYAIPLRELDTNTKGISWATYLMYDPEVYYNPDALEFIEIHKETSEEKSKEGKDESNSGIEFREVCRLLYQNKTKEEIFKHMGAFKKWEGKSSSYHELTFNKANKHVTKEREKKKLEQPIESLKVMLDRGVPKIEWIIEDIIPKQGVVIFGGTSGSYKTWVAMQLALSCTTNKKFLEHYDTKPCRVLYIDEENGNVTIPVRFEMLRKGCNLTEQEIPDNLLISISNNLTFDTPHAKNQMRSLIEEFNPDIVFVDSMVRCMEGEEDKSKDVKKIFATIKPLKDEFGITFVILHHTTKNNTKTINGLRGSGDFPAFSDVVLMFQNSNRGSCNINLVKNRHIDTSKFENFSVVVDGSEESIKLIYAGSQAKNKDAVQSCYDDIVSWIEVEDINKFQTKTVSGFIESKGHSEDIMFQSLKKLIEDHVIEKIKRGVYLVKMQNTCDVELEQVC